MQAKNIIANGNIAFGTSGARGLVLDFTPEIGAAFTTAFLSTNQSYSRVAIGMDNRPSSPQIAADCIAAAKALNINVDFYGILPTPALAYQSMQNGIPAIMITGSHIPFDRNGIKFYRPDGEITKADEQAILNSDVDITLVGVSSVTNLPDVDTTATDNYIERYTSLYSSDLLAGKRIGIYEHSSAGRDVYYRVFEALGGTVVRLGRSDAFVPIDTEAVADTDIKQAQKWQVEHHLDAIFSTDGDGDRPLLSDETGQYLRGDILCLLAAKALNIDALALPVSCNSAVEQCGAFKTTTRTTIGSPYVIAAFDALKQQYKNVAGFEANGGFLLASNIMVNNKLLTSLPTRDALLPALAVLALTNNHCNAQQSSRRQLTITSFVNDLPAVFTASDRLQSFARKNSLQLIAAIKNDASLFITSLGLHDVVVINLDTTDGLRLSLSNGLIIHLRPSGNAPELRCYTESSSAQLAEKWVKIVLSNIKQQYDKEV